MTIRKDPAGARILTAPRIFRLHHLTAPLAPAMRPPDRQETSNKN